MAEPSVSPISVSKEDYLKAVLEAESEGETVISATLAHWLGVSPAAVSMALRRLKRGGFVQVREDGVIRLTASGREAAHRTLLRHHLVERMLAEVFGMPWYQVHDEAERLEHAISPAFEARLLDKLGDTGICPHGNSVLPESPALRARRGLKTLSESPEGGSCVVVSLYERDPALLRFLHENGIAPGGPVRVLRKNPDRTLAIETPAGASTIGASAAERIWVRLASAS